MPQHLAHRLYRKSVLQTDGRGKGVPCGVRGRLSMRWQSCLNTYLLNSSIEITVAGKLSKEKPLFMKMENRYQVNYTGERVNSTKEV